MFCVMIVVESLSFGVGSIFLAGAAYASSKTRCHLSVDFVCDIICSIYSDRMKIPQVL